MIRLFLFLLLLSISFLIYRSVMKSRWLHRLCSGFGPVDDSDVLIHLKDAEDNATARAIEAEVLAKQKLENAKTIKQRLRRKPNPTTGTP